jgi:hypothetical protein
MYRLRRRADRFLHDILKGLLTLSDPAIDLNNTYACDHKKEVLMKKLAAATIIVILLFLFAGVSSAQPMMKWRGSGGWGGGSRYNMMYNTGTVETVIGEIVKIAQVMPMRGMSYGIHMLVKTPNGKIDVHLGPAWYIENQDVKFNTGDKVEITGSRITLQGKPVLIAAAVRKGGETLRLRDERGFPAWAGWRRM